MKILFDISHPADVYLFKNLIIKLIKEEHVVKVVSREKDICQYLLTIFKIPFHNLGKIRKSLFGKILGLFSFTIRIIKYSKRLQPDLFISHGSMYLAMASFILRKQCITLDDTGNKEQIRLWKPFSNLIVTGTCYKHNLGNKQIRYSGYHELAYLHPNYFSPDHSKLKALLKNPNEKIIFVRFINRNSSHDIGIQSLSNQQKTDIVHRLAKYGKVIVSSETKLSVELKKYELALPYEDIHHLLANCSIYFGESATMAAEAAVLGVPAILLDPVGRFYTDEMESKYQLVHKFSPKEPEIKLALEKSQEILLDIIKPDVCQKNRQKLLEETIDLNQFLYNLIIK